MGNKFFDVAAAICKVLPRVEMGRFFFEMFPNTCGHGKTQIGVDVDLADSGFCCFAQLILRNANGIRHMAAVIVDDFHVFRNDR